MFLSLQELEQARATLRSRVIYSPLEGILEKAQRNYFDGTGTPLRKRYGPVFVWISQRDATDDLELNKQQPVLWNIFNGNELFEVVLLINFEFLKVGNF